MSMSIVWVSVIDDGGTALLVLRVREGVAQRHPRAVVQRKQDLKEAAARGKESKVVVGSH